MAGTPGRSRRIWRIWHRWFGLVVGPWLVLVALSGSAIAFYDDLDRWLNPDWRSVSAESLVEDVALDRALLHAKERLPGFEARFIDLPNKPGETIRMLGSFDRSSGERATVETFSHPLGGALLGWRDVDRIALDNRHVMNTLYAFHVELFAASTGAWLLGLLALLWLIDHGPAVALAIPRAAKFASALRIGRHGGRLRTLYDLHRAPGMWLMPFTLVLSVTGFGLAWPEASRDTVALISPVSGRLHYAMPDIESIATSISAEQALAQFRRASSAPVDSILPLAGKGLYAMRSFDRRDPDDLGRLWTYVGMADGRIVAQRHDTGESAGDAFFTWLYPLHSGRAFGAAGQWLILFLGFAFSSLWVTGLMLWWRRRTIRAR